MNTEEKSLLWYPRLRNDDARKMIAEILEGISEGKYPESKEIEDTLETKTRTKTSYYPTAIQKADVDHIRELRESGLEMVSHLEGLDLDPKTTIQKTDGASRFDQAMGKFLGEYLTMPAAESASPEVWNYITLVVFPDIAVWRYNNASRNEEYGRWMGGHRNVFRKLWWRTTTLGELDQKIGEDQAVAIMERPTLGGHPELARAIVRAFLICKDEFEKQISPSDVMRTSALNMRRLAPVVSFRALDEDELNELALSVSREACERYIRSRKPAAPK